MMSDLHIGYLLTSLSQKKNTVTRVALDFGGAEGARTLYPNAASVVLYQMSYSPKNQWSGRRDLNTRPLAPEASALPSCATSRTKKEMARPTGLEPATF
jgi:hypothetical protein